MSNQTIDDSTGAKVLSVGGFSFDNLEYEDGIDYELLCPICHEPMLDPTITRPCQHVFCSACIRNAFLHQVQQRIAHHCPSCRTEFIVTNPEDDLAEMYTEPLAGHMQNSLANRLDFLRVRCPNPGCSTVRQRFLLPDHVKNHCPYTVFPCHNSDCSQSVERRHMRSHCTHELIECRHCHEWLERYQYPDHEQQCPALEAICPSCNNVFKRNEMNSHQSYCESLILTCRGAKFGCVAILNHVAELEDHHMVCTIARLGETISRQDELLQAHRDALLTLTRTNEDLETRVAKLESDLQSERAVKSEDSRLDAIEQQLETQQQQVTDRVSKAELLSFNSVQRQGQFNQYMEACMARIQTDLGAMHHAMMRGRMYPGPHMPMPMPPMDKIPRPGSQGSESVSRQVNPNDDLMPPITRTMSATEQSQTAGRGPELGPFASLAALLPNPGMTTQIPVAQPSMPQQAFNRTRTDTIPRRRRSSEERSVKL